jgi:hypothetical protein
MGRIGEINRIGYHVREMRTVDDAGRRLAGLGTKDFFELTDGRYVTLQRSALSRLLFEKVRDLRLFLATRLSGLKSKKMASELS